jgi:ligand-binding SRPBCC domain-containing protein
MGLTYSSVIDADRDEVFSWHTRPGAITRLIPPWQPVRVLREAGSLRDGRATLTLPGGLRWVAAHQPDAYDPPNAFADELTSLPLPWRHTHQFSPSGHAATLVTDVIETPLPARVLRSTVVYRHRQLAADLAALARARDISQDRLTVAVTGSSGLIGTALTALLTTSGHRVVPLVRRLPRAGERYWRPEDPAAELLDGVDAVIHLAGASIGGRLGDGKQWLAWIALDDLLDIYRRAVLDEALSGPVNAVAPEPVRNADYTRTLAAVLRRPAVLPVPGFGPRLLLGDEGAREIAQASQYVLPERLTGAGHRFRQPELTGALRHLFGREGA